LDGGTKGRRGRSSGAFIEGETWRRGRVFGGGSEIGRPGGIVVGRGSAQRWKEKLTGGAQSSARREGGSVPLIKLCKIGQKDFACIMQNRNRVFKIII
jgi:hypothetical protein